MTKIAFIGAGSMGFTSRLVRDVLSFPRLEDSIISLMDINPERLDLSEKTVDKIVAAGNYPAKIKTTLNLDEALDGADVVICTILADNTDVWRYDLEIPKQYGVDINVGDTRGPSGIFRFLRTLQPMKSIVESMEKYCPEAVLLNYTNPMAMLCGALQRMTSITLIGLCHSVQGTSEMLSGWIGAPKNETTYTCAGINHLAWFLDFRWNGEDAYPLINKAITENEAIYNEEIVRNEMYLALGYYVTESSGHNSEYNWWFRKRPDLIEKYCTHGTGWNPGEYAYLLKEYMKPEETHLEKIKENLTKPLTNEDLKPSSEYAASIINALEGGEAFKFNGNVPNTQLIINLPQDACVEVPVLVDKAGFHPIHIGELPQQCALLTNLSSGIEEMAISASLTGDPELVYQAIAHDPLSAAVLSLAEIQEMTNDLFDKHKRYLPQFKHFKV